MRGLRILPALVPSLLALLSGLPAAGSTDPGADWRTRDPRVLALADRLSEHAEASRRRHRVPGAALAVLHDGRILLEQGIGTAGPDGDPVTRDTVFQVASLSKPVTALGVLLLAEEGRLDLDRPVSAYLRRWRLPDSPYDAEAVTARLLLGHLGGTNIHGYPGVSPSRPLPSLEESLLGDNGGAGPVALELPPGRLVHYSSGGYTVLQLLVEEVSGEPFADFMRRRVLTPLGMRSSSFEPLAVAHDAVGHGWWGNPLPAYRFREEAASGLRSTAGDLARFLAVLGDADLQPRVGISADRVEEMLRPPVGHRTGFGLGFALEAVNGTRVASHTGSNRGWKSVFATAPERGEGIVVLTNSDRGLAMTTDVLCDWGQQTLGVELSSCWVERKSRGTLAAVAALLATGLGMEAWAFWRRRRRERGRRWARPERYAWLGWARGISSLLVLAIWWLFWYTDVIVALRDGISDIVPASSLPATFTWVTVALTGWCLFGVARWLWMLGSRRFVAAPSVAR